MWCLGGSEEDDEYAGQVYLQMDEVGFEDDDEEDNDEIMEEEELEGQVQEEEDDSIDEDIERYMQEEIDSDDDDYKLLSVEEVEEESDEEEEGAEGESEEDEKHCRGAHLVSLYIATFLRTVRREWGNVDKHRVDKFYTAVRLMLSEVSICIGGVLAMAYTCIC
jgi:hypothetical protein